MASGISFRTNLFCPELNRYQFYSVESWSLNGFRRRQPDSTDVWSLLKQLVELVVVSGCSDDFAGCWSHSGDGAAEHATSCV